MTTTRLRVFICIKSNNKGIFKGQILEVYGDMFKMSGYIRSQIKSYKELGANIGDWKEITSGTNITKEELNSAWIKRYLPFINN